MYSKHIHCLRKTTMTCPRIRFPREMAAWWILKKILSTFGITFAFLKNKLKFLLGITVVPTEIEDSAMPNFGAKQGVLWEMPIDELA